MAQTTGSVPLACGKLEISVDGCSTWSDISGQAQSLEDTEQTRMSGEAYTFDGDKAIIGGGKREPMELTVVIVYTESNTEAYDVARGLFETTGCGGDFCIRWSPGGGDVGDDQITTDEGTIIGFTYPPMDASTGGPVMAGFRGKFPGATTTSVTS